MNAPSQAVKILQKTVNSLGGNLIVDNKIGSASIKAINMIPSRKLFDEYQKKRVEYYVDRAKNISSQKQFLGGWLSRVGNIKFED